MAIVSWLVDLLPPRLWKAGNNYLTARLHFCVGHSPHDGPTVRTVEWQGRELAHGTNPVELPFHG